VCFLTHCRHLFTAESVNGVLFLHKYFFVRLTILPLQDFKVIHTVFKISMMLRTRLPDGFHHLVPNYNFHCQVPLKNAKFDLFGSEKCQFANLVANTDWLTVTVLQALACILRLSGG